MKSNMSGDFTVINLHLVRDLKERGLWDEVMVADLKYFDGSLAEIDRVPADLKELYATAFEIEPSRLVAAASRRQKWLDQAQSLNLYLASPAAAPWTSSTAWPGVRDSRPPTTCAPARRRPSRSPLTGTDGRLTGVPSTPAAAPAPAATVSAAPSPAATVPAVPVTAPDLDPGAACSVDDPDCEACQ